MEDSATKAENGDLDNYNIVKSSLSPSGLEKDLEIDLGRGEPSIITIT